MEPSNQQNPNPGQSSAQQGLAHQKVIQPSASFVEELRTSPQAPVQSQPAPQNAPQPTSPTSTQPQRPAASVSSVYPDPTHDAGIPAPTAPPTASADEPQATSAKSPTKVLVVRVVAAVVILVNAINAYDVFLSWRGGYKHIDWLSTLEILATLSLAIGIFMLKEAARAAYVFLSAAILLVSVIGIVNLYTSTHKTVNTQASVQGPTTAQTRAALEKGLNTYNNSLTPQQNEQIHEAQQRGLDAISGSPTELKVKQYLSEGLLIFVAVFPLIIYTRPSIKVVFS